MLRLVVAVKDTWWSVVDVLKEMIISSASMGRSVLFAASSLDLAYPTNMHYVYSGGCIQPIYLLSYISRI